MVKFCHDVLKYARFNATPDRSSCWNTTELAHEAARLSRSTSSAYRVVTMVLPKFALENSRHSPFARGLVSSQSGKKLPFVSVHARLVLGFDAASGLLASAVTSMFSVT